MLLAMKKPKPVVSIDDDLNLASALPEYGRVRDRRDELAARAAELEGEITRLSVAMWEKDRTINTTSNDPGLPDREAEARQAQLLGDLAPPPRATPDVERLKVARTELADIKAAIEVLEKKIPDLHRQASRIIVEKIAPAYREIVAEQCRGLIDLWHVQCRYDRLTEKLNSERVWWTSLRPMPMKFLGWPDEKQSDLRLYLKEAVEYGLFDKSEIPEGLR